MSPETFDVRTSLLGGRNLVEASAGTGKTFALAALYLRLVLEECLTVDRILVVTFTEAATAELRGRIRARLRGALEAFRARTSEDEVLAHLLGRFPSSEEPVARLTEALRCFDEAQIFTIHGFCQRVLQEKAFECGASFDADLVTDERPLLREVVDDFWRREMFVGSAILLAHARRRGLTPAALAELVLRKAKAPHLRVVPEEGDIGLRAETQPKEAVGPPWSAAQAPSSMQPREGDGAPAGDDAPQGHDTKRSCAPEGRPRGLTSGTAEQACRRTMESLRSHWPAARAPVGDLLAGHPALNRNQYRVASVPGWLAAMDLYLAQGDPLASFEALEKFSPAALEAATKRGQTPPAHPFFELCGALVAHREALRAELDRRLLALQVQLVHHARAELPRRKREENVRSFDDLLLAVREALEAPGGPTLARTLRDRYPAALIDEFQDTDPTQYAIFRTLFPDEHGRLFLIGDPKQAIYGFRGADIFAYLEAVEHTDRRWTLGRNWRSTPRLVQAVNALFSNAPNPFVLEKIPFHPVEAALEDGGAGRPGAADDPSPLRFWFVAREGDKPMAKATASRLLPAAVGGELLRLLGEAGAGRVSPGDVAVLVRTNQQAKEIKDALEALAIPAVLYSSESLFASPEAEEMLRVLGAVVDPRSERRVRAALVTDLLGASGEDLARLALDEAEWDRRLQRFARYRDLWADRGFVVMARALLAEEGVRERLLPLGNGERRLTNVLHCIEVLQRAAVEEKLGPEGLVQWLGRRLEERDEAEEYQVRLETDEQAVKVVTVHKSKGLEYPIVLLPYAWAGARNEDGLALCHDPEAPLGMLLDLGSEALLENRRRADEEERAENLRLFYVALTRARNRCCVAWGGFKNAETSAPAHLLAAGSQGAVLSDAQLLEQLDALSLRAKGALTVVPLPEAPPPGARYEPVALGTRELRCRPFRTHIPTAWGVASFSSLVSGREEAGEFPDRDERVLSTSRQEDREAGGAPTFFDFPRGTRAGNCLHDLLERLDYGAQAPALASAVRETLEGHGFDAAWVEPVTHGVGRVLQAPLDPGLTLSALGATDRVNELEFYLPTGLLTPRGLSRVFAAHGGPDVPDTLAEALEGLEFRPTQGALKGFIDLVFQAGGRYYIVDWKSNHLGNRGADYGPAEMQRAVDEHLYGLQYHLYAAALHRHLTARLPAYDYDVHFGGVFYLFLRGMDPGRPGQGVYRDRPSRKLVDGLSAYLSGEGQP